MICVDKITECALIIQCNVSPDEENTTVTATCNKGSNTIDFCNRSATILLLLVHRRPTLEETENEDDYRTV